MEDKRYKRLLEDFNELKDINKEMHLNFKAYQDTLEMLAVLQAGREGMIDWLNPSEEMLAGLQAGREGMQDDIDQAVLEEREACAMEAVKYTQDSLTARQIARAIRARGEE